MQHGTYHRPSHRPTSGSGPGRTSVGTLSVPFGAGTLVTPCGQHRIPRYGTRRSPPPQRAPQRWAAQRRAPDEAKRPMQVLLSGLGALIMMGVCGLSAFIVVADERRDPPLTAVPTGIAAAALPPARLSIDSQMVDPTPLTAREVFPRPEITMVQGASPYRLRTARADADCVTAATGTLRALLRRYGCSQAVRGTLLAPVARYPVTAGVLNLPDDRTAAELSDAVKSVVDARTGSFAGLAADRSTRPVRLPSTQVSWQTYGHYLIYCVIARPDGRIVADRDPFARHIVFDLVESYLRDGILSRRTGVTS